ncbi:uncharacterized protein BJ171DRAFT_638772 [Polychytrium aggregatum]|uniref:uncharacterized protein n=1 Tax=Polychytrium aggregatum TaxID=110093 RepID=UPI0022FE70EC|nr:uncharacterized protein BJ171DRAFT_638772 [Polychytrium aggregatum]KAI9193253.1 hypothetical protein BJ171DRAFT_638772 [Polychytrium aggregatum]
MGLGAGCSWLAGWLDSLWGPARPRARLGTREPRETLLAVGAVASSPSPNSTRISAPFMDSERSTLPDHMVFVRTDTYPIIERYNTYSSRSTLQHRETPPSASQVISAPIGHPAFMHSHIPSHDIAAMPWPMISADSSQALSSPAPTYALYPPAHGPHGPAHGPGFAPVYTDEISPLSPIASQSPTSAALPSDAEVSGMQPAQRPLFSLWPLRILASRLCFPTVDHIHDGLTWPSMFPFRIADPAAPPPGSSSTIALSSPRPLVLQRLKDSPFITVLMASYVGLRCGMILRSDALFQFNTLLQFIMVMVPSYIVFTVAVYEHDLLYAEDCYGYIIFNILRIMLAFGLAQTAPAFSNTVDSSWKVYLIFVVLLKGLVVISFIFTMLRYRSHSRPLLVRGLSVLLPVVGWITCLFFDQPSQYWVREILWLVTCGFEIVLNMAHSCFSSPTDSVSTAKLVDPPVGIESLPPSEALDVPGAAQPPPTSNPRSRYLILDWNHINHSVKLTTQIILLLGIVGLFPINSDLTWEQIGSSLPSFNLTQYLYSCSGVLILICLERLVHNGPNHNLILQWTPNPLGSFLRDDMGRTLTMDPGSAQFPLGLVDSQAVEQHHLRINRCHALLYWVYLPHQGALICLVCYLQICVQFMNNAAFPPPIKPSGSPGSITLDGGASALPSPTTSPSSSLQTPSSATTSSPQSLLISSFIVFAIATALINILHHHIIHHSHHRHAPSEQKQLRWWVGIKSVMSIAAAFAMLLVEIFGGTSLQTTVVSLMVVMLVYMVGEEGMRMIMFGSRDI